MHIPDGFISHTPTIAATSAASAGAVAYSLRSARKHLQDRQVPLVGVTAAFIFAAQMVNMPIAFGTSGHLMGGVLAAILLGPWVGCLVMAVVLAVQAIGFADGGITALGANLSLMGLVGAIGGYYLFRAITALLPRTRGALLAAAGASAWTTVVVASVLASTYLLLSDFPQQVLVSMVSFHALIGVIEAVITVMVLSAVLASRPDLVTGADRLRTASAADAEIST